MCLDTKMSKEKNKTPTPTSPLSPTSPLPTSPKTESVVTAEHPEFKCEHIYDCETWNDPEFVYAGPFIPVYRQEPGIFLSTPYNTQLTAFYRGTKAEKTLKKGIPKLIEKVTAKIADQQSGEQVEKYKAFMEELSYSICTNKEFEKFDENYKDAKLWNDAINDQDIKLPLMSRFGFTEAYAHAKIHEGMDFLPEIQGYDYHADVKQGLIDNPTTEEAMYVAASRFLEKVPPGGAVGEGSETLNAEGEKKRREEFMSLLQFCLWANRNNKVLLSDKPNDMQALDPFQFMDLNKTKILVDESNKIYTGTQNRVKAMRKVVDGNANNTMKMACSCHRLAKLAGMPICEHEKIVTIEGEVEEKKEGAEGEAEPEPEKAKPIKVCPAKVSAPKSIIFDIVCENAGMELFAVMCFAHFLVARNIVEKVRFHVKKIPWYETHATAKDITNLVEFCKNSTFTKTVPPLPPPTVIATGKKGKKKKEKKPPPPPPVTEAPPPESSEPPERLLQILGQRWSEFLDEGRFIIADDGFWVTPYTYKQMKEKAPWLYKTLRLAGVGAMFIGDVNYRKLLDEKRVLEGVGFDAALQGFNPAPMIAVRNLNCELLCGMSGGKKKKKKKKGQAASVQVNPEWFDTDDYGVIQYYGKPDTSKQQERPCSYYGVECRGGTAQLVQLGLKTKAADGAEGGDGTGGEATLNVCTYPGKGDNLCD